MCVRVVYNREVCFLRFPASVTLPAFVLPVSGVPAAHSPLLCGEALFGRGLAGGSWGAWGPTWGSPCTHLLLVTSGPVQGLLLLSWPGSVVRTCCGLRPPFHLPETPGRSDPHSLAGHVAAGGLSSPAWTAL